MYCPYCGNKLEEDTRFCGSCGAPVSSINSENGVAVKMAMGPASSTAQATVPVNDARNETGGSTLKEAVDSGRRSSHRKLSPFVIVVLALALAAGTAFAAHYVYKNVVLPQQQATQQKPAIDSANVGNNDETTAAGTEPTSQDKNQYHIVTDYYEFDVPEYWRGKVDVRKNGNGVSIVDKQSGQYLVGFGIETYNTEFEGNIVNAGDVADSVIWHSVDSADRIVVEASAARWTYLYWDWMTNGTQYDDVSPDDYESLLDLATGGKVSTDNDIAEVNSWLNMERENDYSDAVSMFLKENLIPTVKAYSTTDSDIWSIAQTDHSEYYNHHPI